MNEKQLFSLIIMCFFLSAIMVHSVSARTLELPDGSLIGKANGDPVNLKNNASATSPSYDELITWILKDKTDEKTCIPDKYTCGNFAERVHNRAEKAGIKAGIVVIIDEDSFKHGLNCFKTTDKGLIFIDCTGAGNKGIDDWGDCFAEFGGGAYKTTSIKDSSLSSEVTLEGNVKYYYFW